MKKTELKINDSVELWNWDSGTVSNLYPETQQLTLINPNTYTQTIHKMNIRKLNGKDVYGGDVYF